MSEQENAGISRLGPACGCIGCTNDAVAVIDHPEKGRRTVCDGHVEGHPIIRRVAHA